MKTPIEKRKRAFDAQGRRCYYCKCLMWLGHEGRKFREQHSLTKKQARELRCTAEHLRARCDGGGNAEGNIVAACRRCNGGRHEQRKAPEPSAFVGFVEQQLSVGEWHSFDVMRHRLRSL